MKNMKTLILLLMVIANFSFAESIDKWTFNSPADEARYRALVNDIRCPVCQGQSIGGSNAGLAQDLRKKTKEMIEANNTNAEIKKFMVDRYGDFVSFTPPMKFSTYILWFAPFLFLALAIFFFLRKPKARPSNIDISKAEDLLK
jgi:cytochrome c-type biogenesis protein CcmH